MKKATRFLAILLALVFVLSMAGCQKQQESKGITIEFWHTHGETFGGPNLEAMIKEFNETNGKGITVKSVLYEGYNQQMTAIQTGLAGGTEPALATVSYSNLNYAGLNFTYVPITDVIDKYFPEDKDYLANKYEKSILDLGVTVEGKQLGLPWGLSIPIMYYNLDLLEAAGLDTVNLPTTWQEVREYAKAVVEKTGKHGLYIQIVGDTYSIIPMFYAAGIDTMFTAKDGGGYVTDLCTPESVEVWTFFQEMFQEGSAVFMTNTEGLTAMSSGELAMYLTTSARIKTLGNSGVRLDTYYHPKWEGRDLAVCLGGNMLTMWNKNEDQQKAAWEFIKFLLEPDNMANFDNGTGYVPPTKDVTDEQYELLKNPLLGDVVDEKTYARQWTSWPGTAGLQVDQELVAMRDKIYNEGADVGTLLQEIEDKVNELIGK